MHSWLPEQRMETEHWIVYLYLTVYRQAFLWRPPAVHSCHPLDDQAADRQAVLLQLCCSCTKAERVSVPASLLAGGRGERLPQLLHTPASSLAASCGASARPAMRFCPINDSFP